MLDFVSVVVIVIVLLIYFDLVLVLVIVTKISLAVVHRWTSPDICYIVGAYDRSLFLSCCCAGVMTATKCRSHSLTITELWFIAGPRQISATLLGRTTGRYF